MSRIGKKPIELPKGVEVTINGQDVSVKGPKGTLSLTIATPIAIAKEGDSTLVLTRPDDERNNRALHGLSRTLVANMIEGVTKGYEKNMQVVGTGWQAQVVGKNLKLVLGYANAIMMPIPEGITVTVDKATGDITPVKIIGIDRQLVGQFASAMRQKRKPEPYNGKGVKYTEEVIKRKQGKQFGA